VILTRVAGPPVKLCFKNESPVCSPSLSRDRECLKLDQPEDVTQMGE
jgi:hypothetical protein